MLLLSLGLHAAMAVLFAAHLAPRSQVPPPVYYINLLKPFAPTPRPEEMPLPRNPVEKKPDLPAAPQRRPSLAEPSRKAVVEAVRPDPPATIEAVRPEPPPARVEAPPPRMESARPPEPELPEATVRLERQATADLGPGPNLHSRRAGTRQERLPEAAGIALSRAGGVDLATAPAGAAGERYSDRPSRLDLPAPVHGQTVAKAAPADPDPGPGPHLGRGKLPEPTAAATAPAPRATALAEPAEPEAVPIPASAPKNERVVPGGGNAVADPTGVPPGPPRHLPHRRGDL